MKITIALLVYVSFAFAGMAQQDTTGFVSIFDGKTLRDWEGDPIYWQVKDECLFGEVTPATLLAQNSFVVYKKKMPRNFELKVSYKVSARGNSGINYRSTTVAGHRFALQGYQADIDGENQWSGQNYEERGRTFLALRGQVSQPVSNKNPIIIGSVGDKNELTKYITSDWNEYNLIVNENTMIHMINGHVMSVVIDLDTGKRAFDGLLGVQVHVGPPMTIAYKNFRIKPLP